jgi:hypothetical protein
MVYVYSNQSKCSERPRNIYKKEKNQDQGLLLNPSTADLFFEAIPSGGIPHASFCPPEGATIAPSADPNDKPGLSGKPKPCKGEDEGFAKGLIIDDFDVADEEKAKDEENDEVGAPHEGTISSGSPSVFVVGRGVCVAYASSKSLLKEFVVIGVVLANELA